MLLQTLHVLTPWAYHALVQQQVHHVTLVQCGELRQGTLRTHGEQMETGSHQEYGGHHRTLHTGRQGSDWLEALLGCGSRGVLHGGEQARVDVAQNGVDLKRKLEFHTRPALTEARPVVIIMQSAAWWM